MYWLKVIRKWWAYVYPLLAACLVANLMLLAIASGYSDGVVGAASDAAEPPVSNYQIQAIALIFFGPLINIFAWFKCIYCLAEAEDDVFLDEKSSPSSADRAKFVRFMPAIPGVVLVPLTFWLYTPQYELLWPSDSSILSQPGFIAACSIMLVALLVSPKLATHLIRRQRVTKT